MYGGYYPLACYISYNVMRNPNYYTLIIVFLVFLPLALTQFRLIHQYLYFVWLLFAAASSSFSLSLALSFPSPSLFALTKQMCLSRHTNARCSLVCIAYIWIHQQAAMETMGHKMPFLCYSCMVYVLKQLFFQNVSVWVCECVLWDGFSRFLLLYRPLYYAISFFPLSTPSLSIYLLFICWLPN